MNDKNKSNEENKEIQEVGNTKDDNTVRDIDNPYFIKGFDCRIKKDFPSMLQERRKLNMSILLNCQDIDENTKVSLKKKLFKLINGNSKIKVFIK